MIRTVEIVMILIQLYSLVHWTFGMMGLTRTVTVPVIMTKMAMDTILLPPVLIHEDLLPDVHHGVPLDDCGGGNEDCDGDIDEDCVQEPSSEPSSEPSREPSSEPSTGE